MDTATRKTGVKISRSSPSDIKAYGLKPATPAVTPATVVGKLVSGYPLFARSEEENQPEGNEQSRSHDADPQQPADRQLDLFRLRIHIQPTPAKSFQSRHSPESV